MLNFLPVEFEAAFDIFNIYIRHIIFVFIVIFLAKKVRLKCKVLEPQNANPQNTNSSSNHKNKMNLFIDVIFQIPVSRDLLDSIVGKPIFSVITQFISCEWVVLCQHQIRFFPFLHLGLHRRKLKCIFLFSTFVTLSLIRKKLVDKKVLNTIWTKQPKTKNFALNIKCPKTCL